MESIIFSKKIITFLCFIFIFQVYSRDENKCGKVVFGDLDWDSNRFHVDVASFILKHGYGCEVDRIPGSTLPLLTALSNGGVHVLMEIWKQNIEDGWMKFEGQGLVQDLGVNFPDATQGWFIPTYMQKGSESRGIKPISPNLISVEDLKTHTKLFTDPEDPTKGRFYNCVLGWSCEDVNTKKLQAYGLNEFYTNFKPGTGAALAAVIASKYEKGENFVAYYWGPTWVLGKYNLTMLKEPPHDPLIWKKLVDGKDLTQAVAYPIVQVTKGVNVEWAKKNPIALEFLKKYQTKAQMINEALSYIRDKEGRTVKDAALNFLMTRQEVWSSWVDQKTKNKILAELKIDSKVDETPILNFGNKINQGVDWLVKNYGPTIQSLGRPLLNVILVLEKILLSLPWWLFSLLFAVFAFTSGNKKLFFIVFLCLTVIQNLGLWSMAMQTLVLMVISTIVSLVLGIPIGILSSKNDRFQAFLLPLLDAMQTMPSFVYLIPALMLFGLGKVPAVFATVIYSIVPIIRLTNLGIREVDQNIIEAATSFGANQVQLLRKVEIPLALPTIMAGINQTTMLALSMVVIASMIGARGLGEQVLLGIQKLDVGQGFTAGIAIVMLAVVLDRITQSFGRKWDNSK